MIQRQIGHTEAEIDRLVYDLYGLTKDEIALVEEGGTVAGARPGLHGLNYHKPPYNIAGARQVSRWPNARKCYGRMSNHMRTKTSKNDTKTIKRDTVSVKNVKNQYGFVLPSLTLLLHTPLGASAKAVLWITWVKKARQTAPKTCFSENQNATYIKNRDKE